jgi:hypothetical protein
MGWKPRAGSSSPQSHRFVPPVATIHPNHQNSKEMSQLSENSSVVSNIQSNGSSSSGNRVGVNLGQESLSSFSYRSTGGIATHRLTTRTRNNDNLLWKPPISHQLQRSFYRTPSLPVVPKHVSPTNASTRSAMAAMAPGPTPVAFDANAISKQVFATAQAKLETFLQGKLEEISIHAMQTQASMASLQNESSRLEQKERAFYRRMVASEEEHDDRCAVIEKQLAQVDQRLKVTEIKTDRFEQQTGKLQTMYTKISNIFKSAMNKTLWEKHPSNDKQIESSFKKHLSSQPGEDKSKYRTRSSSSLTPVSQNGSNIVQDVKHLSSQPGEDKSKYRTRGNSSFSLTSVSHSGSSIAQDVKHLSSQPGEEKSKYRTRSSNSSSSSSLTPISHSGSSITQDVKHLSSKPGENQNHYRTRSSSSSLTPVSHSASSNTQDVKDLSSNPGENKSQYRTRSVSRSEDGSSVTQKNTNPVNAARNNHKCKNDVVDSIPITRRNSRQDHQSFTSPMTFKSCVTPCDKENTISPAIVMMKTPDGTSGRCHHSGNNSKKRSISTLLESQDLNIGTASGDFTSKTAEEEIPDEKDYGFLMTRKNKTRKQRFGGRFISGSDQKKQLPISKKQRVTNTIFDDFDNDDDYKFSMFP